MSGELACFPPCLGPDDDGDGFSFEQQRSCVVPGSAAAVQGIACVPPPPDVLGLCPVPLVCPSVDGQLLGCGCTHVAGLGLRKAEIFATGGDRRLFASAMMETPALTTDYPFGDVFPGPDGHVGIRQSEGQGAAFGPCRLRREAVRPSIMGCDRFFGLVWRRRWLSSAAPSRVRTTLRESAPLRRWRCAGERAMARPQAASTFASVSLGGTGVSGSS